MIIPNLFPMLSLFNTFINTVCKYTLRNIILVYFQYQKPLFFPVSKNFLTLKRSQITIYQRCGYNNSFAGLLARAGELKSIFIP